ncbi:transcription factor HES-4 isoform X1 [Ictidomys tridecemlineatus]
MPADTPEKPSASPLAGAQASASPTPDKPRSAAEQRKSSKPILEKRRRARINQSLAQLQTLILDAVRKDVSRGREGGVQGLRLAEWDVAELQTTTLSRPPELPSFEAGEGRHPGDDGDTSAKPASLSGDSRTQLGPRCPGQVPCRLQRVPGRGDPLPGWLRGCPSRSSLPLTRPPGSLPAPAGVFAPLCLAARRCRRTGVRGLRWPPAAALVRRPLSPAAPRGRVRAAPAT